MSSDRNELELLLVQRAIEGLDEDEARRLTHLLAEQPDADAEWVDRLVGELDAASLEGHERALAPELRERLVASMPEVPESSAAAPTRFRGAVSRWGGWAAAAVVAGLWFSSMSEGVDEEAGALDFPAVAALSDAVSAQWEPGGDDTGSDVSGEIVWSSSRQAGVMRLRGLAANAPGEFQYQLWIFDRTRDERYPVDGGVFDVPVGATEAEVTITAKLHVDDPTLFAVTVEPPGGVVVSDRERIATVAQVLD